MSKNKMTPAEVADQLGKFIAKQEDTLRKYPIGPMANSARANLKKGYAALEALRGQNEAMRTSMQGAAQPRTMALGGQPLADALGKLTPTQRGWYDVMIAENYSPEAALAVLSVTHKESQGDYKSVEKSYANTSAARIREVFPSLFPDTVTDEFINTLKKDDEKFFNHVYGDKLGNGGEGYKYRGRGILQLTGKDNYAAASQAIFGDDRLVQNPDLVTSSPEIGGQIAHWYMGRGKGLDAISGVDLSSSELTPEQLSAIADSSYAKVAGVNTISAAQQRRLYAEGAQQQRDFLGNLGVEVEGLRTEVADMPDVQAEEARRAAETQAADEADTLAFLNNALGNNQVPEEAVMMAPGQYRGYLGGTYGAESTGSNIFVPNFQALETAQGLQDMQAQRDATMTPQEQASQNARAGADGLAPDFKYEDVLAWGEATYGVSEGQKGGGSYTNTDNMIIGANTYEKDRGHVIFEKSALDRLGGAGITVDETRVLLQSLVNNGLSVDQAYEALADPNTYREMKANIPDPGFVAGRFGKHTLEMLQSTAAAADTWARTTENRKQLATVVDRGEEGGADWFSTELAPGLNPEVSMRDAAIEADKNAFLRKNPGAIYLPGRGGTMDPRLIDGNSTLSRQLAIAQAQREDPNSYRIEPDFMTEPVNVLQAPDMNIPVEQPVQDGVTRVPDVVIPPKEEELPTKTVEEVPGASPAKEIQTAAGPEVVQMNMPNVTPLMGIPAMASLASVGIQRRALEQMRGPAAPVLTDIPQFSYESNLGQQMMDARNATNAAMRGDGMSDTARAGMRGNLLAQRFEQEARLRTADNAQRQAAQRQYDAMAFQARALQDQLRNKYADDQIAFNNQKALLSAQIRQEPLNVLSATTQDYLKNIYAPSLAQQIEALGRQYNTTIDTTGVTENG